MNKHSKTRKTRKKRCCLECEFLHDSGEFCILDMEDHTDPMEIQNPNEWVCEDFVETEE